jgi:hypothetical protein
LVTAAQAVSLHKATPIQLIIAQEICPNEANLNRYVELRKSIFVAKRQYSKNARHKLGAKFNACKR